MAGAARRGGTGRNTHTQTHTHMLRAVIANSVAERILRAKTLQLHVTGFVGFGTRKVVEAIIAIASGIIVKLNKARL